MIHKILGQCHFYVQKMYKDETVKFWWSSWVDVLDDFSYIFVLLVNWIIDTFSFFSSSIKRLFFLCAASDALRQTYRQYVGSVIELINGEVTSEEFREVAKSAYDLFGRPDIDSSITKIIQEKK